MMYMDYMYISPLVFPVSFSVLLSHLITQKVFTFLFRFHYATLTENYFGFSQISHSNIERRHFRISIESRLHVLLKMSLVKGYL